MKTILVIFLTSLGVALLLTPAIAVLGRRYGIVDAPSGRKVHIKPIPRIGGVAIFLAFFGPFLGALFYSNPLIGLILSEPAILWLCCGATLVFLVGLADDIFPLHPLSNSECRLWLPAWLTMVESAFPTCSFPGLPFLIWGG